MPTWRVNNSTALGGEVCAPWAPNHAYSLGARVVCRLAYGTTARRAWVYECTTAGTSHATTEPTWPASGTVADGATLVWTCRDPSDGTWDNASCFLNYVMTHTTIAAGDVVLVDDGHVESYGASIVLSGSADKDNYIKIYCVDKATDALSTGAVVRVSGAYTIMFNRWAYSYGVCYATAGGDISVSTSSNVSEWILEAGRAIEIAGTKTLYVVNSANYDGSLRVKNADIKFIAASGTITCGKNGAFIWQGGAILTDAASITALFANTTDPCIQEIRDIDFSAIGAGSLFTINSLAGKRIEFSRCKLHASTTLTSVPNVCRQGSSVDMHHCSSGNDTYSFRRITYQGVAVSETTIVRTGGASDGTTPISMKMASSALTLENIDGLESVPIHGWTDAVAPTTFTIEVVHDSATALQDDEIWMEFEYPADNSSGLGAFVTSRCAPLGAPADIPDSAEAWTTTGMANPNTRKLSVTVTPGKAGPITARVVLAKASTTVYVDPMITES